MAREEHSPELADAQFDARVRRAGLVLTAVERNHVLATARYLHQAAAKVRVYNSKVKSPVDDPD